MPTDRRSTRTAGKAKFFRDLCPTGGGGDRRDKLLIRPASLAGEVPVVEFQPVGVQSNRAHRSGGCRREPQCAKDPTPGVRSADGLNQLRVGIAPHNTTLPCRAPKMR